MAKFCVGQRTYTFTFKIGFFFLCLFVVSLCTTLGFWQLHRYDFKKTMLANYQQRFAAAPIAFHELKGSPDTWQFENVNVKGRYDNASTMLVQNQLYKGQVGFEVLTPIRIANDNKLLLVDRGWVPDSKDHALPKIEDVSGEQNITGYIKIFNEHQFILGKNILNTESRPLVMQKIDVNEISKIMHQEYYPVILRLHASQPHGFIRDWIVATILPERHMAYAVQWFALAIVLMIAFLCFCCERVKNETK